MKFATIETPTGQQWGLVEADKIFLSGDSSPDLKSAIATGDLGSVAEKLRRDGREVALEGVTYAPVIPNPDKIFCVGLNYQTHREETAKAPREYPPYPVIFARYAASLSGHGTPIVNPVNSSVVDFEGELAIIIGKAGHRIEKSAAMDHIAGFACFNDVSMRDWQQHGGQWTPGKNFPTSGPFGPVMVTPDEVGPLDDLMLTTTLDGEIMQRQPFRELIHDVPTIINYISSFIPLAPGDVIAAGTPGGVGFTRKPPVLLDPGKTVVVEIDRIGRLENRVIAE